ncbi:helix-turn-helix domain-containing protein [Fibrella aestuarina]|uniref:helix-turn-helix domain-containing protein n=1 Tax=Fibrella aestuarina TaxID=651143 RepID=UPI0006881FB0|nr:helix-turn-helix transcriptional regulator [Fibrella aestuarina]
MKRSDLIVSPGYLQSKIQIDLYNQIQEYMDARGLNRTQLANELGFSKGYISQVLNGDFDHKISKLIDLSLKVGKVPFIYWKDVRQVIREDSQAISNRTLYMHDVYAPVVIDGVEGWDLCDISDRASRSSKFSAKVTAKITSDESVYI